MHIFGHQIADETITGDNILDESIEGKDIKDGTIQDVDIGSVGESKVVWATKTRNVFVGAPAMEPAPTIAPSFVEWASGSIGFGAWELVDGSSKALDAYFVIPEDFKGGEENIMVEVFYAAKSNPATALAWRYQLRIARQAVGSTGSAGTSSYNTATVGTSDVNVVKKLSTLVSWEDVQFSRGDLATARIYRRGADGLDTYTDSIYLLGMNVKYPSDRRGT